MEINIKKGNGIGILGVLQIIFIVLKLIKLINWSWWIVLIPTWFSLCVAVFCLFIFGVILLIAYLKSKF